DTVTRTEASRRTPAFHDIEGGNVLESPLHHRCPTFDGNPCGVEILDDRVELHASEIRARPSSVAGSSAASASYRLTWNEPGPFASRAASSAATPNAASVSAVASTGSSFFTVRKQSVMALDMQPVPVMVARSGCLFATASTRSLSDTWLIGPVTDA